jgi:hypothetical protein
VASLRPGPLPGIVGQHTLKLTEQGLEERTEFDRSSHDWRTIVELRRSRFGLLLRIAGGRFHFIPRDAFTSTAEFDAFHQDAMRLRSAVTH